MNKQIFKHEPSEKYIEDSYCKRNNEHYIFKFNNSYGANVMRKLTNVNGKLREDTDGAINGLWELSIVKLDEYGKRIEVCDIIGSLSIEKVNEKLDEIKGL